MTNPPHITSKEEFEKAKAELERQLKAHKKEATLFREQVKMFVRQGISNLPEKQQQTYQAIEQQEKELESRLEYLQQVGKNFPEE